MADSRDRVEPDQPAIKRAQLLLTLAIVISLLGLIAAFPLRTTALYVRIPAIAAFYAGSLMLIMLAGRPWRTRGLQVDRASVPRSLALLSGIAPIAMMPALFAAFQPRIGVDFLVIMMLIAVAAAGGVIAATAWFHPVACPPSCARCGYRLDAFVVEPEVCPECGVGLGTKTAITTARRDPDRPLFTVGLVIAAFPVLLGGGLLLAGNAAYRVAPTGVLIALADESDRVWPEMMARELTPEQRLRLIDNIIEGPRSAFGGAVNGLNYIVGEHAAGTLDPLLAERFFGDAVSLSISGPSTIIAGDEATITIAGDTLGLGTNLQPAVHIGPITAADGTVLVATAETSPRFGHEFRDRATRPAFRVTLSTPGELELSVRVVVLAQNSFWPYKVRWNGVTPTVPPEAVWHRTMVLTHTITVRPSDESP